METLWAALPQDARELIAAAFRTSATSPELARAAQINHLLLTNARQARELRTPAWQAHISDDGETRHRVLDDEFDEPTPATLDKRSLVKACRDGDVGAVEELIAKGMPLHFYHMYDTPLCHAAQQGHAQIVRLLLTAGVVLLDASHNSPLYAKALWSGHLDVVKVLTEFGVPRWGPTFALPECSGQLWDAESAGLWDAEARGEGDRMSFNARQPVERQQELYDFLVATRKFNPRAGDPCVYTRLQVEEQAKILTEGSETEQLRAIKALSFLACDRYREEEVGGFEAVRELALPAVRKVLQAEYREEDWRSEPCESLKQQAISLLHLTNDLDEDDLMASAPPSLLAEPDFPEKISDRLNRTPEAECAEGYLFFKEEMLTGKYTPLVLLEFEFWTAILLVLGGV